MYRAALATSIALVAIAAVPRAALAAGEPLVVTSQVMKEVKSRAADGSTRIILAPAAHVVPGDRVVMILSYRNTGAQPLADIVLANPLPAALAFRAPAQASPAPEISVDGTRYAPLAQLRVVTAGGAARAAAADDVTHLRWRLAAPLKPGAQGRFAYQAVVR